MATPDKSLVEVLHKRIDQHLKYYEILEDIRWKFTTAFAAGAGAAMAYAISKITANASSPEAGAVRVAAVLVIGFSLAGIITHIRIAGLMRGLSERMTNIQGAELMILKNSAEFKMPGSDGGIAAQLEKSMTFPRFGELDRRFWFINVAIASFMVFSLLSGVAVLLIFLTWGYRLAIARVLGLLTTAALGWVSIWLRQEYVKDVEGRKDA